MIKFEQNIHQGYMMQALNDTHNWIIATHNNLIAAGLIQTSVTGQYVSSTGTTATTSGQFIGYRVYELNDSYSSAVPVYIRFDFHVLGASASSVYRFGRLTVTVGFNVSGSGTISNSQVSKALKNFQINNSAAPVLNANTRTLTVKGDDFVFHGNELCAGYQSASNIYDTGFFVILRNKTNGVVDPTRITFIYPLPTSAFSGSTSLRYTQLVKNLGVSNENYNPFRVPRIRSEQGLLVASETDTSENGFITTTDRLICFRATSDDTPWVTHKLSIDGLTEKLYLHIPMSFTVGALSPASLEKLTLCAVADIADVGVGAIGVLISE